MTTANIYENRFDEALSQLVAFPEIALKKLHGDNIEYLALIVDKAYNAGLTLKNVASILFTINTQFTKIDFAKEANLELIFDTIKMHYTNKEASK